MAEDFNELTDDDEFVELIEQVRHPRRPQIFRPRENNFEKWDDSEFKERYRLSKEVVLFIVAEIRNRISSPTNRNHALSAEEKVLITLRFLATGAFLKLLGDNDGIHESTAYRAVVEVLDAIARLGRQYIRMPTTEEEMNIVRQEFYNICRFPRCVGAIDCTHVKIFSPGGDNAEIFRNRKSYFSFNVQAVCDANMKISNLVCHWPGSAHDANIFRNSRLHFQFENGIYGDALLVGDSGYPLKSYLLTPLANPRNRAEHLYNEAQIRTRNVIERCFGVLKRRFPILALGIRLKIDKVESIIVASVVLHNIACTTNDPVPEIDEETEQIIAASLENHNRYQDAIPYGINDRVRNMLVNHYFQNLINNENPE